MKKKWKNPQINVLGIRNTNDQAEHFCHERGLWHKNNGCNASGNGDWGIEHTHGDGVCEVNGMHPWNGGLKKSNCCCVSLAVDPDEPMIPSGS